MQPKVVSGKMAGFLDSGRRGYEEKAGALCAGGREEKERIIANLLAAPSAGRTAGTGRDGQERKGKMKPRVARAQTIARTNDSPKDDSTGLAIAQGRKKEQKLFLESQCKFEEKRENIAKNDHFSL